MSKEESSGDAPAPDAQGNAPSKDPNADIYENRGHKKMIRVITVMAYLFSVSFVGIVLSAYYIFLWEPPNPRLIERGKLRADPQMQFLMAMPSETTDLRKKENDFFLETQVNRTYKPLLDRMTYGSYNENDFNVNLQNKKKERLNVMLLKLKHSLVETHDQNRNLSKHEATISSVSDNSSIKVEKMLDSTKRMENSISNELYKNITEEKTGNNDFDLPPVFTDSVNMLNIDNTWKQKDFNEKSISDANLIAKTNDDIINGSNHHDRGRNNSFKAEQKFPKINILDDTKELIKQDETDDRQLINDNRKNDPNNIHMTTTSKEYTEDLTKRLLPTNVSVNNLNFRRNYSNTNEYPLINYEKIARNEVSTISSSHDSKYIHNNPEFHQPSDDPTVITRNSKGEKIRVNLPDFLIAPG